MADYLPRPVIIVRVLPRNPTQSATVLFLISTLPMFLLPVPLTLSLGLLSFHLNPPRSTTDSLKTEASHSTKVVLSVENAFMPQYTTYRNTSTSFQHQILARQK